MKIRALIFSVEFWIHVIISPMIDLSEGGHSSEKIERWLTPVKEVNHQRKDRRQDWRNCWRETPRDPCVSLASDSDGLFGGDSNTDGEGGPLWTGQQLQLLTN